MTQFLQTQRKGLMNIIHKSLIINGGYNKIYTCSN